MKDDSVVGEIRPDEEVVDVFKVKDEYLTDGCDHLMWRLEKRWSKVICENCGEEIEAFDLLLRYAEWEARLAQRRRSAISAERSMLRTSLRGLARRLAATDTEKAEITKALAGIDRYNSKGYITTTKSLWKMERQFRLAIEDRSWKKRKKG